MSTKMDIEKISFGIITRSLTKLSPIKDFLENAQKYGHTINHLIIGYNSYVDPKIINQLKSYCQITTVQRGNSPYLVESMKKIGLTGNEIETIIGTPHLKKYGMVAYGTSRNYVLLTAIFKEIDFLMYFDSDIYPKILVGQENGEYFFQEIDFVGNHLKFLRTTNDIVVTSSDYTGYYIIPKMNFPYLRELLFGLQKEDRFYYINSVDTPVVRNCCLKNIFNTNKILGGNQAIDLRKFALIPPFYSTTLVMDDECFLGRGEDTLFGPIIYSFDGRCVDIDLLIFHDCFGDFPNKPDISIKKNLDRFYYACMGWIIRNPFFNWIRKEYFDEAEKIDYKERLEALKIGSKSAAEYFSDERFLKMPEAFKKAYGKLPQDIKHFHKLINAWNKMKFLLKK